jgi:5-hydroxyisourate hydrolase
MITTHVLDTALGKPGRAIAIELERAEHGIWHLVGAGITDDDGRLRTLTPAGPVTPGVYRIRFQTGAYQKGFFPVVEIQFTVEDGAQHYHVPLLLSP